MPYQYLYLLIIASFPYIFEGRIYVQILSQYVTLDYWRNTNSILTSYEFKININSSTGRTSIVHTVIIFIH